MLVLFSQIKSLRVSSGKNVNFRTREAGSAALKPLRDLAASFLELSQDGIILTAGGQ